MINNTTTFIHTFFFGQDEYSADYIDRNVDPFIVQVSLSNKWIATVERNEKRLYRILPEGKKILKK